MAQTKFAIVYFTQTKIVHAIFQPDDDAELDTLRVLPHHSVQIESLAEWRASGQHIHDYSKDKVGHTIDDWCLVVDKTTGAVVDGIHADITCEIHPDPTKKLVKP